MTRAFKRCLCLLLVMALLFAVGGCSAPEPIAGNDPPHETEDHNETTAPTEPAPIETSPLQPTTATEPDETQPQEITPAETDPPPAVEVTPSEPTSTEQAHSHSYSVTNTVSPTCTAQGYTTFTCSCGSSYQDNVTQATGHSWGAWTTTKEATTSAAGEQIRNCAKCGATESQAIAQLPAETPSEPAACQHSWEMKWYPEQGHYDEVYVLCKCGARFNTPDEWNAHVKANLSEAVEKHTSWTSNKDYIIDSPERYEWICSKCGAVTDTQP